MSDFCSVTISRADQSWQHMFPECNSADVAQCKCGAADHRSPHTAAQEDRYAAVLQMSLAYIADLSCVGNVNSMTSGHMSLIQNSLRIVYVTINGV